MRIICRVEHGSDGTLCGGHSLYSRICCISSHQALGHNSCPHLRLPTDLLVSGLIQVWIRCIVYTGRGSRSSKNYTLGNSTTDAIFFLDAPANDPWTSILIVPSCFSLPGFCDLRIA